MNNDLSATQAIRLRRSIRRYRTDVGVSDEQLHLLLEAAMMAPSACNSRSWEFIVVRSRPVLDMLAVVHPYAGMLKTAPLAIVVCALPDTQGGISEGYYPQDCGAATQNILVQATAIGLGTCWCGVYPRMDRSPELCRILGIPEDAPQVPFNIIAVGVPDGIPPAHGFYDPAKVRFL